MKRNNKILHYEGLN
ncbi:hypothetical protein [Escherichia coli]|nr:hypothetical protein [Escherichia coli]EKM6762311.1 hypothetical protein [Escherichia coli]MBA1067148.1 hypothetical protein [Escherichia coli]MBC9167176.1 hypothetical protein [Escherichia coli]MCO0949318.1 hypothetical protein [Escherichia coli]MCP8721185.1 hypothetical protein [Escherichia coli]